MANFFLDLTGLNYFKEKQDSANEKKFAKKTDLVDIVDVADQEDIDQAYETSIKPNLTINATVK